MEAINTSPQLSSGPISVSSTGPPRTYVNVPRCSQQNTHAHTARKSFIIIKVNLARAAGWVGDGGPRILLSEKERGGGGGAGESAEEKKRTD